MRRAVSTVGVGLLTISLGLLCVSLTGCVSGRTWHEFFPSRVKTLPNRDAIDRALLLCSLTDGDQPFHLTLEIPPPPNTADGAAQVEIYWLNPSTYRTIIHSRSFTQTRIVNGNVVEEHDTGDFYPRWIENFVDAILTPIPNVGALRKTPGAVPVEPLSQACITASGEAATDRIGIPDDEIQVCLAGSEPKITSGREVARYVAFDDFQPFSSQQVARTLVNDLPDGTLLRAHITHLSALAQSEYPLLKAHEFTLPAQQMQTTLVAENAAKALLQTPLPQLRAAEAKSVYIRTDRTGRVREAYLQNTTQLAATDPEDAASHARMLKFKPLIIDGAPRQMEATISVR